MRHTIPRPLAGPVASSVAALMLLAACGAIPQGRGGPGPGGGFERQYFQARTALEDRKYDAAIRRYTALLERSGPLESRTRLELAHAYLRNDQYAEASRQARMVATAHDDNRRMAALAVVGTAQHRLAQEAMSDGDFGPRTVAHLRAAETALAELLAKSPDFDPLGTMAQRRDMAAASLERLGG